MIRKLAVLFAVLILVRPVLAGASGETEAKNLTVDGVSVFEADGVDGELASRIADVLTSPDVEWIEEELQVGDVDIYPATAYDKYCGGEAHKKSHTVVTTRAYYTKHLAYDHDPRCVTYTFLVSACRDCDYMAKTELSRVRVSYCHPYGAPKSPGDVNRDGTVNAKDVVLIMKRIVGALAKNAVFDPAAADANADGKINSRDVIRTMSLAISHK